MPFTSSYTSSYSPYGGGSTSRYDFNFEPFSSSYRRYGSHGYSSGGSYNYRKPFERSTIFYDGGRHRRFKPNSYRPVIDTPRYTPQSRNSIEFDDLNDMNRKQHHTESYGVRTLVVRRGQPFDMELKLPLPGKDGLRELALTFSVGNYPQENKGTAHSFKLRPKEAETDDSLGNWQAKLVEVKKNSIRIQVTPSPDAVVGDYKLKAVAKVKTENDNDDEVSGEHEKPIYVLFNAWCKDDDVYMKDENERHEYVLNESGRVYAGDLKGRPWTFGQFAKASLTGAILLLEKSSVGRHLQGNVVMVVRALSAMVNCNEDDGVLHGRWDGEYYDGKSPSEWVSSISIMERYMRYRRPVKYGQCWVFSALCVTVCRALGIPCRSVTNFDSAHDTDGSLTIDRHFDPAGHSLSDKDDSVWNFHVWNEAWMERNDLPDGYSGWQAFDATPQELSEGKMRCGPASVKAIKEGDVFLSYDTRFIFAEVNGDRLVWICDQLDGRMIPVKTELETNTVGNFISTKAVGSNDRVDVTHLYKYKEGSTEERRAVQKASRFACIDKKKSLVSRVYSKSEDVKVECEGKNEGGDLEMHVSVDNQAQEVRTGFVRINATATYYTGIAAETLDSKKYPFELKPGKDRVGIWKLPAKKYMNDIDEDADVKVTVVCYVNETQQYFVREKAFLIDKEDIQLEVSNRRPRVGEEFEVTLKIYNPVKVDLTQGIIHIEGPGVQKDFEYRIKKPIGPFQTCIEKFQLSAKYPGKREIVASFKSKQLVGLSGSAEVEVQ